MSEKRKRRHCTTDQKVAILKRHLVDKEPVSALCEEYDLQPSVFYEWQHKALDKLGAALEVGPGAPGPNRRERQLVDQVAALEAKLVKKDSVIAEISAEYVGLNKELGEP
jgi:transposase-like protein